MNDFLQQLRSGHKNRFEKPRRAYDNPQYRNNDRTNQRDRKGGVKRKPFDNEHLQAVKTLLTSIADSQEAILLASERQALAQERLALALEAILGSITGVVPEIPLNKPQEETDTPAEEYADADDWSSLE